MNERTPHSFYQKQLRQQKNIRDLFRCPQTFKYRNFLISRCHLKYSLKRRTVQIVGSCLVNVIIEPVCIQIVCMGTPEEQRLIFRIVVGIVSLGQVNRQSFPRSLVFTVQGYSVILRMSHNKNLSSLFCHSKKNACFFRFCENCQLLTVMDILCRNLCMPGMGCQKTSSNPLTREFSYSVHDGQKAEHFVIHLFFFSP